MEFSRAQLREFESDIVADFSLPQDPNEPSFCICRAISAVDIICAVMETVVVRAINEQLMVHAGCCTRSSDAGHRDIDCTSLHPAFLFELDM